MKIHLLLLIIGISIITNIAFADCHNFIRSCDKFEWKIEKFDNNKELLNFIYNKEQKDFFIIKNDYTSYIVFYKNEICEDICLDQ